MTTTFEPGDIVTIYMNGEPVSTIIDDYGTQRFIANEALRILVCEHAAGRPGISLNDVAIAYQTGRFSKKAYADFMMLTGYSVEGFCDLPDFEDFEIRNPLW